jgi:hypothetical protein
MYFVSDEISFIFVLARSVGTEEDEDCTEFGTFSNIYIHILLRV